MNHYGSCICPDARLAAIDGERKQIKRRQDKLDALERDILGLRPTPEKDYMLRGGPGFDYPCARPDIIECALWECQHQQRCQFGDVVGTAGQPAELKTHTPRHDATGGE